uniref:Tectonin beta-propeller repeat containing 2 n=1 Tax=Scleropages formosus TaxID=113540 RepID=A0A8C9TSN8_SCLFO
MAAHHAQMTLKEFCPLYYLYSSIPGKIQKGFRSIVVYLTALDVSSDYIAVGSSIGMLYLYCRQIGQMNKYSLEGKMETITTVRLLSCFDDLVAVGTASGRVAIFQLVSPLPGRNKQLRRFDVVGLHKSTVTALAWSANGMKLFSGDDKGKIVYSAVDLDQGTCVPRLLLEETSAIVQLEYSQKMLLVSSNQRSLLFYTQDETLHLIGTKPRKSNGKFGACFHPALCKQSDMLVYAARPGLRLWRADIEGVVQDTHLLKELFGQEIPYFELFPHSGPIGGYRPPERQLGILRSFMKEDWVLSWNEYSIYLLDCLSQVIIGGLDSCGDIVSVSCTENEIFILKGDRDIIRISNQPEGLHSHCKTLLMCHCTVLVIVLEKLVVSEGPEPTGSTCTTEPCSRSSSITSCDSALGLAAVSEQSTSDLSSSRYTTITQEDLQQELVIKAIKVKRKTKRRRPAPAKCCFSSTLGQSFCFSCGTVLSSSLQLAESWMGYSGPGCGILSLVVTDRYIWCLDFKGGLYCSALPNDGIRWQKFEDNVQQVAVSQSGSLLWKVEQKTNKAFACGKVSIKGKRHWYEAHTQTAFVALSDDSAWIICTNGDLYLQTGLSGDRPCARAVKVDCPCPFAQITARGSVVWALSEQGTVFYREGLSSFCAEGEQWKYDTVSERQGLKPVCISLGCQHTVWALDNNGNLWFRSGITAKKPQGEDKYWWQVSITDYVVFDQCSIFQTLIQATQSVATATKAPVERVADRLRVAFWPQQPHCQFNLVSANNNGIWIASSRNDIHVAKGNLIGTYWKNVVPRGTASTTKWAFVFSSAASTKEGSFLWLGQNKKDLLCLWDQDAQLHPSTVQLPAEIEMVQLSACRDALWGIDSQGRIHIRTLSPSCPTGIHWTLLDLSQLGNVRLVSFSCGNQNVWACDENGIIYFRVGTQPLNSSMMLPAWICIEPPEQPVGMHLISVHTSPNDRMLWAIDSRGNIHVRTGISEEMPVGTDWEHIPGLQASHLALSVRTVWVQCPNGEVARRYGITDKNPAGDYWKKIPGLISKLTVTPEDELWAISVTSSLIRRLTKPFQNNISKSKTSLGSMGCEDLEDEWEVI